MPLVTIEGPVIDVEKKRKLARGLTQVAAEVYGFPESAIIVVIKENSPQNVGLGGTLVADREE